MYIKEENKSILESTREEQKTCKRKLFENDMTGRFVNVWNKSSNNEKNKAMRNLKGK
jgi:hypothetical protein